MQDQEWTLSRPEPTDLNEVVSLMRAYDVALSGEPDTDLEDVEHDWRQIDLERDAWLASSPDNSLCGYAAALPGPPGALRVDLYTSPHLLTAPLPALLLDCCHDRTAAISKRASGPDVDRTLTYLLHLNEHYRDLFIDTGYEIHRMIYQLNVALTKKPDRPKWPAGLTLRTFTTDVDAYPTYELVQEAFDRPGRIRPSFEQWKQHMIRSEIYEPELWQLAFDGEDMVGACLAFDYPAEGWVRQLAVSEKWRRRGLGSALLKNAFVVFHQRRKPQVGLTTESDNPDALEFYERNGMTVKRQYDEYVRPITA